MGTCNKLEMKNFGLCEIPRKSNSRNSYEVELLEDVDILPIFKIVYLYEYHETTGNLDEYFDMKKNNHKK